MVEQKKTKSGTSGRSKSPKPRDARERSKTPPPNRSKKEAAHFSSKSAPMSLSMLSVSEAASSLPLWSVQSHKDNSDFEEAIKRCIPSKFVLIASQDDVSQSQEDYFAMDHFKLPLPEGKRRWRDTEQAGSVATCAFLQLMYENPKAAVATEEGNHPWSTLEILEELQGRIKRSSKQHANPTISSSRPLGPPRFENGEYAPFYVVPPNYTGTRRALLIGCVTGEEDDKPLKGAINDAYNVRQFLICHCGFKPENMVILEDNFKVSASKQPTKKNILEGFANMIKQSKPKDVNFIQFSGHGGRVDHNLYILPSDYSQSGNIMDDEILTSLIKAMPKGVYTTMLVDSCYSGTVGELPYILKSSATKQEIEKRANFDTEIAGTKQTLKPSTRAEQKIETFYDLDTRNEALEKEQKGGEEYQMWKNARKLERSWMHFEPGKLVEYVSDHSKYAAEMVAKAGAAGYEGLKVVGVTGYDGLKIAADYTAKGAASGAAAVARVSSESAKLVSDGAVAAAKVSADGAKRVSDGAMSAAASVATVSSDGVKRVSDGAVAAAKVSADGAKRVSDGAMSATASVTTVSSDGVKRVSDGAVAAGKVSADGAKRVSDGVMAAAASVATVSSDGIKSVSDGAVAAASSVKKVSLDGAKKVSDGAMGAVSSTGKALGSVASAATSTLLSATSLGHKKSNDKSTK